MLKLYHLPKTRSFRVLWTLEELGVPYEIHTLNRETSEHKSEEYKKIHPLGMIPALVDNGAVRIESAAICQYLADKFPDKNLSPKPGTKERARYEELLFFAIGTLEPPVISVFEHSRFLPEEARIPSERERHYKKFIPIAKYLESTLLGKEFLMGTDFSVADILVGSLLSFAKGLSMLQDAPGLVDYIARLGHRPAFQRALSK